MVSAKNLGLRLPTLKGETWGEANTHLGNQPKKHCRAAHGLPTKTQPTPPPHTTNLFLPFFSTTKRVKTSLDNNLPPPSPPACGRPPVWRLGVHMFVGVCAFVRVGAYICLGKQVFVVGVPNIFCADGRLSHRVRSA